MPEKHYHVFTAPADGPARCFTCRSTDVFNTREAALKWATRQRASERRFVRRCAGGTICPGDQVPGHGERPPLPQPRPRKPRTPARVTRIRNRIAGLSSVELTSLELFLDRLGRQ